MIKLWQDEAWEDYLHWQTQDKKTLKRILDTKDNSVFLINLNTREAA